MLAEDICGIYKTKSLRFYPTTDQLITQIDILYYQENGCHITPELAPYFEEG